jgi:hypothetical protein
MGKVVSLHRKREESFLPKRVYVTIESGSWRDSFLMQKELAQDKRYVHEEVYSRYPFLHDEENVEITVKL